MAANKTEFWSQSGESIQNPNLQSTYMNGVTGQHTQGENTLLDIHVPQISSSQNYTNLNVLETQLKGMLPIPIEFLNTTANNAMFDDGSFAPISNNIRLTAVDTEAAANAAAAAESIANQLLNVAGIDKRLAPPFVSSLHNAPCASDLSAMPFSTSAALAAAAASTQPAGRMDFAAKPTLAVAATSAAAALISSGATAIGEMLLKEKQAPTQCFSTTATPYISISTLASIENPLPVNNEIPNTSSIFGIPSSHLQQSFNLFSNMDSYSAFNSLMTQIQPLASSPPSQEQSTKRHKQDHTQKDNDHHHQQQQQQQQQQQMDSYRYHNNNSQNSNGNTYQSNFLPRQESSNPHTPVPTSALFDMQAFANGSGSGISSGTNSSPMPLPQSRPNVSGDNTYPLALDAGNFQANPAAFVGIGTSSGNTSDTSGMLLGNTSLLTSTGAMSLPVSANALVGAVCTQGTSTFYNSGNSNDGGITSSLSGFGIPNMMQQQQHQQLTRPYSMTFGLPSFTEPPRMMYDDRGGLHMPQHPPPPPPPPPPLMQPGGSNWLRIRQPIDYVAPLKKPMNSFLLYSAERRVQLRQTHPDLNTTQQSTILAREWAALAEEEKEKYRAEAKQLRDDYNARRAELSLKLQQQLNQQHFNLNLAHSGTGQQQQQPPQTTQHYPQMPPQSQSLESLDTNMNGLTAEQLAQGNTFGFQQPQFHGNNSGVHISQSPFQLDMGLNPIPSQNQHGPQTPQDDHQYSQLQVSGNANNQLVSDSFQFDSALTVLGNSLSNDPVSNVSYADTSQVLTDNIYGTMDSRTDGLEDEPGNKKVIDSDRWQQKQQQLNLNTSIGSSNPKLGYDIFGNPMPPNELGTFLGGASENPTMVGISAMSNIDNIILGQQESLLSPDRDVSHDGDFISTKSQTPHPSVSGNNNLADSSNIMSAKSTRGRLSSPTRRTRKKAKKDPDAPKHPMSAFLYYLTSVRPRQADQFGDMSIGQQTKIIAKQWKELSEAERAPWEELAKNDKERYARERREYHSEARHLGSSSPPK